MIAVDWVSVIARHCIGAMVPTGLLGSRTCFDNELYVSLWSIRACGRSEQEAGSSSWNKLTEY